MIIQTFKNKKGLIFGEDPRIIDCSMEGVLRIGATPINVIPGKLNTLPEIANGNYKATFTTSKGDTYEIERVSVRGGRIVQPSKETLELMELRCRLDELETKLEFQEQKIHDLENIFDTNSLNFLIN